MQKMSREQRLRNTAEGFLAGLVACGFRGPWPRGNLEWEFSFYKVWADWPPPIVNPNAFPTFKLGGGSGVQSEAQSMFPQLNQHSPFYNFKTTGLPDKPLNLEPREYLQKYVKGAAPKEWVELAQAFLDDMAAKAP